MKNSRNCFKNSKNFQLGKFEKSEIWKTLKILQFQKSSTLWNCSIKKKSEFSKFYNLENSKNMKFVKSEKFEL